MYFKSIAFFLLSLFSLAAVAAVDLEGIDSLACPMAQLNWDGDKVYCQARDSYKVQRGFMSRRLTLQEASRYVESGDDFRFLEDLNLEPEGFQPVYNQFYLIQDVQREWGVANVIGGRLEETNERVDILIRYNLYGEIVVVEDLNVN